MSIVSKVMESIVDVAALIVAESAEVARVCRHPPRLPESSMRTLLARKLRHAGCDMLPPTLPPVAFIVLVLSTLHAAPLVRGDDWPFFRGPHCNGVSTESDWDADWSDDEPIELWRRGVGIGASSVVVSGPRAVTMGSDKEANEESVWCLDVGNGKVNWRFTYASKFDARQFEGGTASTPTIDGDLVFSLGYLGQVHCLDLATGQLVWSRHLVEDFHGRYSSWKYAGSPLVVGDVVILDTGAEGNSTVALDKSSGRKVWGSGDDLAGYATPIPFVYGGRQAVLVFKARAMVAYELDTGTELWRIDWRTYYDCNASTPTVFNDKLFISTGYGGRSARGALFQLGDGQPQQLWLNQDIETKMNSAVVYEGHVYCVSEIRGGRLMCCSLKDGNAVWSEPSFARYGTLMIVGGRIIVLDEQGELVIAESSPDAYRELARAKVLSERCWCMPVLANGCIFAKSNLGNLVCLDVHRPGEE